MINSPLILGGLFNQVGTAMVNPALLAWGLRDACLEQGVRLYENTKVLSLRDDGGKVNLITANGSVRARKVAIATNAFPPLLKHLSAYIVPVYDYVIITEPLSAILRASIGWQGRQGLSDSNNQFHYSQLTADGRILWGGYDAVYHWNNGVGKQFELDHEVFGRLAEHFFVTFPSLEGLRFTHTWGGAIDTCSRFSPFWGTACGGRCAYVLGFTGLGVGSSRFGAQVMLDLLGGNTTSRTRLKMVRTKPVPFPPEPLRSLVIQLTRRSLDQADHQHGQRNFWLQVLDLLGLGFDS
jgi:glycine/D-amino acid oxidase-like deaminating enzyme